MTLLGLKKEDHIIGYNTFRQPIYSDEFRAQCNECHISYQIYFYADENGKNIGHFTHPFRQCAIDYISLNYKVIKFDKNIITVKLL